VVSGDEMTHVLLRYSIDVYTIPVTRKNIDDIVSIPLGASADGRITDVRFAWDLNS